MTDPRGEGDYLDLIIPQSFQWPKIPAYYNVCTDPSIENAKRRRNRRRRRKIEGKTDNSSERTRVIFKRLLLYISVPKLLRAPNQGWSLLYLIRKSIPSSAKVRKFSGNHKDVSEIYRMCYFFRRPGFDSTYNNP